MKYLLPLLMLMCIIAFCFSVGKTYAVITEATNVVVNTFYGESGSGEPETEPEAETEPETESEPETETEPEAETETTVTETGTSETGTSETGTSETDTGEGAKTGDDSAVLIWIILAAAAFAGIVIIGIKLLNDKIRRNKKRN